MEQQDGFDIARAKDIAYVNSWVKKMIAQSEMSMGDYISENGTPYEDPNGFRLYEIQTQGGAEGGGESIHAIYAIVTGNVVSEKFYDAELVNDAIAYVKFSGSYYSYNGEEWNDNVIFVNPMVVQTVIFKA